MAAIKDSSSFFEAYILPLAGEIYSTFKEFLASLSTTALLGIYLPSLLVISLTTRAVYRRYFHPLSKIPGPFLASFTSLWLVFHDRTLKRHVLDLSLHEKYGPIVRIAPNNIMLSSPSASKIIYAPNGDYNKSDYYIALGPDRPTEERMALLSETNMPRYKMIRRVTGPVLSIASVKRYEALCDPVLERYVKKMASDQGQVLDLLKWMHIVSTELIESMIFSESDDIISSGNDSGDTELVTNVWREKHWVGHSPMYYQFRRLLRLWLPKVGLKAPKEAEMEDLQCVKVFARRIKERTTSLINQKTSDFFTDVIKLHDSRPAFRESWIPLMAFLALGAGFDTMGTTLTALIIQVARDPRVKEKIQQEIRAAKRDGRLSQPIPNYDECAALPYLQAATIESMRLHSSIGAVLERVVPTGGATFEGHFIPGGTTVGCNPRVVHRDEEVYGPNAAIFNPERYLSASVEKRREMEAVSLRWGGGIRKCPGDKMATVAMMKFLVVFFGEFDFELLEEDELVQLGLDGQEEELAFATTKWKGTYVRLKKLS